MRPVLRGNRVRLKHLNASGTWPSGNARWYYRPKGQKAQPLPDLPHDHPAFLAAYAAAAGLSRPPAPTPRTGTIGAGCVAFLASDTYLSKSPATRAIWRRGCDDIRQRYGAAILRDLEERHIRADLARLKPHPYNQRLKVWRAACKWWAEVGLLMTDPSQGIKKKAPPKSTGHEPWTAADVAKFRQRWPIEAPERLAFELLHWTGARMSDAVRLSEGMIDAEGWMTYRQQKTGGEVSIPITAPAPDFAAQDGHLLAAMDARPQRHAVLMVTAFGTARSIKAASAWFSAAARAAGIAGKSAHGLRKYRAIIMAERGATTHQIAAWTGHESLSEVQHYSSRADKRRILTGTDQERKSSNSAS